jgi:protein-S-isoprenylcysteine O-methyltransferase Ste14
VNNINIIIGAVSGQLWLAFILLWLLLGAITNRQRAVVKRRTRNVVLIWWAVLIVELYISRTGAFHHLLDHDLWPGSMPAMEAGFVLELLGMGFAIWARGYLGSFWSSDVVLREGQRVVSAGPYRLVRHPIYSGILLAMLGSFLIAGGITWIVIFAEYAVYVGFKAFYEERLLTRELGDEYVRYRSRTRMLIPWLL